MTRHARIIAVTLRSVTLRELQAEPLDLLDAAVARAREIVDPVLLALVADRIAVILTDAAPQVEVLTDRERAVCSVIDQMLIDVARLDDAMVQQAGSHFADGELADLVMASYALEAQTRLRLAASRVLGGMG